MKKNKLKNINDVMVAEIGATVIIMIAIIGLIASLALLFHPAWILLLFTARASYDKDIKKKWLEQEIEKTDRKEEGRTMLLEAINRLKNKNQVELDEVERLIKKHRRKK